MITVSCRNNRVFSLPEEKTALLTIDMQVDFLEPEGESGKRGLTLGLVRSSIPRVAALQKWARDAGMRVWHTREARHEGAVNGAYPILGSPGHAIVKACKPLVGEPVFDKDAFSAFHGTSLLAELKKADITHLVFCGVTTSCCVSATLRAAIDHGFICLTVSDCCAAFELDDHDRALDLIESESHLLGDVCRLEEIVPTSKRPLANVSIRPMTEEDGAAVMQIYAEGIARGGATFETNPGSWEDFRAGKRDAPQLVAVDTAGQVRGFVVLSQTSKRAVYRGICEVMIYVAPNAAGQGVGNALMSRLIEESEREGIWLLTAGIFPDNTASLLLHNAHGFRCRGRQVGAGQLQSGPKAGQWQDVLRLERRSDVVGVPDARS